MLPEWAPNAHPLLVHFPIALFVAALVADVVLAIRRRDDAVAAWLYFAAGLGALAAFLSGRNGADAMLIPAHAVADLNTHADWGLRAVWLLGLFGLARVGLLFLSKRRDMKLRLPLIAVAAVAMFVVARTAEHGGKLVYAHGLGTSAGEDVAMMAPPPVAAGERLQGSWTWTPDAGLATLLEGATVDVGTGVAPPRLEYRDGETVLAIDGPSTILVADTVTGVQVDVRIDPDDVREHVRVVHNATGVDGYHYTELQQDGSMSQGGRVAGADASMASGQSSVSGWQVLRVVGEGTHYRAYIDGRRVTHGHGPAAPAGRTGLHVADGTLYVSSLSATPIE